MDKTSEKPSQGVVDKSNVDCDTVQEPPMHPKHITAFINHFILSTCSFLNQFAGRCEEKFIILERKIQKLDAALIIVEAKIASIKHTGSDENNKEPGDGAGFTAKAAEPGTGAKPETAKSKSNKVETTEAIQVTTTASNAESEETASEPPTTTTDNGVKACDDVRYKKFFKMLQFGVPMEAVKIKMKVEGAPPEILDTPNLILPDGTSS